MKFSEKLIELRKQKGLSQEELGNMIDVSRQTVSKWEAEQTTPEVDKVKELSKVFNVSIEYLLNDEAEKERRQKLTSKKTALKIIIPIILTVIIIVFVIIIGYRFITLKKYSEIIIKTCNDEDEILHHVIEYQDKTNEMVKLQLQKELEYITITSFNEGVIGTVEYINKETGEAICFSRTNRDEKFEQEPEYAIDNYEINLKESELKPYVRKINLDNSLLNAFNPKYKISTNNTQVIIEYEDIKLFFDRDTETLEKIEETDEKYDTNTKIYYAFSHGIPECPPLEKPTLEIVNKNDFGIGDLFVTEDE